MAGDTNWNATHPRIHAYTFFGALLDLINSQFICREWSIANEYECVVAEEGRTAAAIFVVVKECIGTECTTAVIDSMCDEMKCFAPLLHSVERTGASLHLSRAVFEVFLCAAQNDGRWHMHIYVYMICSVTFFERASCRRRAAFVVRPPALCAQQSLSVLRIIEPGRERARILLNFSLSIASEGGKSACFRRKSNFQCGNG